MDFSELIKDRYSVRQFKEDKVSEEQLMQLLEAARLARNNQKNVKGIVINAFSEPFIIPLDLFDLMGTASQKGSKNREKQDKMEAAADALRQKMGNMAVTLGVHKNEDIGIKREWKKKEK